MYSRQDQRYPPFTHEQTRARNLFLLTPNAVLFQGQKDQNNLTTLLINSPAFIETSIPEVKKTHKLWLRNLENNQEIQVQSIKHKCSLNYKTQESVSGGWYSLRDTTSQVPEPRDGNAISVPTTAQPMKHPRPCWVRSGDPTTVSPSSINSVCCQNSAEGRKLQPPILWLSCCAEGFKTASPTREAGRFGKPSLHFLFASVAVSMVVMKTCPSWQWTLLSLPTCSVSELEGGGCGFRAGWTQSRGAGWPQTRVAGLRSWLSTEPTYWVCYTNMVPERTAGSAKSKFRSMLCPWLAVQSWGNIWLF